MCAVPMERGRHRHWEIVKVQAGLWLPPPGPLHPGLAAPPLLVAAASAGEPWRLVQWSTWSRRPAGGTSQPAGGCVRPGKTKRGGGGKEEGQGRGTAPVRWQTWWRTPSDGLTAPARSCAGSGHTHRRETRAWGQPRGSSHRRTQTGKQAGRHGREEDSYTHTGHNMHCQPALCISRHLKGTPLHPLWFEPWSAQIKRLFIYFNPKRAGKQRERKGKIAEEPIAIAGCISSMYIRYKYIYM